GDITLEGDDYKCPICSVGKDLFELIETTTPSNIQYKCSICGYIYEGDITLENDDYKCPICSVQKDLFELV
ncbi:MAG: iron hydrogenase, partial [Longicatena sp.]